MTQGKGWGPRRPWTPGSNTLPPDVKSGDWIRSDLTVRAQHLALIREWHMPEFWPSHVWLFQDGQAFLADIPTDRRCTHMVSSYYQVWQGDGDPPGWTEQTEAPRRSKVCPVVRPVPAPPVPVRTPDKVTEDA